MSAYSQLLQSLTLLLPRSQPRIVTNDTQLEEKKVPAALRLPFGKLFFGYAYIDPAEAKAKAEGEQETMVSGYMLCLQAEIPALTRLSPRRSHSQARVRLSQVAHQSPSLSPRKITPRSRRLVVSMERRSLRSTRMSKAQHRLPFFLLSL